MRPCVTECLALGPDVPSEAYQGVGHVLVVRFDVCDGSCGAGRLACCGLALQKVDPVGQDRRQQVDSHEAQVLAGSLVAVDHTLVQQPRTVALQHALRKYTCRVSTEVMLTRSVLQLAASIRYAYREGLSSSVQNSSVRTQ
jgi:hypothetical protein